MGCIQTFAARDWAARCCWPRWSACRIWERPVFLVHTDKQRDAALALYQAAGFRAVADVWVYRKD